MEEKARLAIEYAIKKLDEAVCPPEYASWKAHAEEVVSSGDIDALRKLLIIMGFVVYVEQDVENAVEKILIGRNILTPSLIHKGLKFRRQPLLTKKYRKAVKSAVARWYKAKAVQLNSLTDTYKKLPQKDTYSSKIIFMASRMDIASSCRQKLSTDLKAILNSAEDDWLV